MLKKMEFLETEPDYIGMLTTIMNGLALKSGFERIGLKTRIQSSLVVDQKVAENYVNEKTIKYLEEGEVVIFVGGTGRPYFTTDTALQHYLHQK